MSKILITGGAGFIGSHLVKYLLEKKHNVVVVDNLTSSLKENIPHGVTLYKTNILSKNLKTIFKKEKPDFVSHHAAQVKVIESIANPSYDAKINMLGTINVLECAKEVGVKKIIFSSTGGAIYGNASKIPSDESCIPQPESPYAISKFGCEWYIKFFHQHYNLPYLIFRYANVYGPGQRSDNEGGVVAIFVKSALSGKPLVVYGTGKQARDFIYVSDIVEANDTAFTTKKIGTFNVGTGKATTVNDLVCIIKKTINKSVVVKYGEKREGEVIKSVLDINAIKKHMHWKPEVTIEEGIEKTIQYYKRK